MDFRSDRMPSNEGEGRARSRWQRAWDAYASAVTSAVEPAVEPFARRVGVAVTEDMVGFWLIWQLHGGFEGLQQLGMSRASIYRKVKRFRKLFGEHPDVYELPGVTLDVEAYLAGIEDTLQEPDRDA